MESACPYQHSEVRDCVLVFGSMVVLYYFYFDSSDDIINDGNQAKYDKIYELIMYDWRNEQLFWEFEEPNYALDNRERLTWLVLQYSWWNENTARVRAAFSVSIHLATQNVM